jgi:hypothetical protein
MPVERALADPLVRTQGDDELCHVIEVDDSDVV